jgi:succinate dehydrogenase/fumarate reductase flavoprotein subunit
MNQAKPSGTEIKSFRSSVIHEMRYDIVIMGGGFAGLRAAVAAKKTRPTARVGLLTAGPNNGYGCCSHKTHGANAAMNPGDSVAVHASDTLRGGGGIGKPELVATLCEGAPEAIRELEQLGVQFDKIGERYDPGFYGGSTHPRSVHAQDMLGLSGVTRLWEEARRCGVEALHSRQVLSFVIADNVFGGVIVMDTVTGETEYVAAPVGITAMGGGACVYPIATISDDKQATAAACFLEAGGALMDSEMMQFHPTGLARPGRKGHGEIMEEELRAQGAQFFNVHGERFMKYEHEDAERATRDVNARACYREIMEGRGTPNGGVIFDLSMLPPQFLQQRFPYMLERLRTYVDLTQVTQVETSPAAHFWMGGIEIDIHAQTSIKGLFACGEDAAGIHGGNRLGGNGVSDALVFGKIAGEAAARSDAGQTGSFDPTKCVVSLLNLPDVAETVRLDALIKKTMWHHVGPIRSGDGLQLARLLLNDVFARVASNVIKVPARDLSLPCAAMRSLYQKLILSRAVNSAAIERTNSVGAHYRTDADGEIDIYNTSVRMSEDGVMHTSRVYRAGTMNDALSPEEAA